jgi:glucosamine--fructose-6-phosphate aminotransferase (isomerizing)
MCGIVGYIGSQEAVPILLEGLRRLEYRGYDSAGIAIINGSGIHLTKKTGKLHNLQKEVKKVSWTGSAGIGHTRWATHGRPTEGNAHPHMDCTRGVAVVHNGIVENYDSLKERLIGEGHTFSSETDTEVIAHLIESHLEDDLEVAVRRALLEVKGNFAVAVLSEKEPDKIIGVKLGSPLVVGLGKGEYFLSSDIPALLKYTKEQIVLDDGDLVVLSPDGARVSGLHSGRAMLKTVQRINWDVLQAEKEGYPHFMLKEIHEQPRALRDTIGAYVRRSGESVLLPDVPDSVLARAERVRIVACGTSYHAALAGKFYIESLSGLPVEVDIASEFRYQNPMLNEKTLTLAVSQSGETADTLAAIQEANKKGSPVIAVCNVVGSSAARQAQGVVYTHAGPEIGVASSKTFTAQLVALILLGVYLGHRRNTLPEGAVHEYLKSLLGLPELVSVILAREKEIIRWADRYWNRSDFLFIGRGACYPVALEGALKLKEVSYIHAEGYPAGEMKHGPIALIDEQVPVVVLIPQGPLYGKMMGNLEEVRSRDGVILAVATEGDEDVRRKSDHVFYLPPVDEFLLPILMTVPLQLMAYHIAVKKGCDVDRPRNLAKSVTVE